MHSRSFPWKMSDEQNRKDQKSHVKCIMCDTSRDLPTLWRLENAFWSPLKNFLVNRKEGTRSQKKNQWIMPFGPPWRNFWWTERKGQPPCRREGLNQTMYPVCCTRYKSGSFHKNVNETRSKSPWRVLILPAVAAGFGTGRYTMCDLDPVEVAWLSGTRYGL